MMADIARIKQTVTDQTVLVAKLIGNSCVPALSFGYPNEAKEKLTLIESLKGFESAGVFNEKGELFAYHDILKRRTSPQDLDALTVGVGHSSKVFVGRYLYLMEPIIYQGKTYGAIYLRVLSSIRILILFRTILMMGGVLVLLALAYLLATALQKIISAPIFDLVHASEQFASTPGKALHLWHDHVGEMGILFDSFNAMTATIHERQEELQQRNVELAQQRDAINKKNQALDETRRLLEKKALDLERVSRYKSEFLANMSHELRTPLNSILMFSDVLMENRDRPLSEKLLSYVERIGSSGRQLLHLIGDILDLSKLEAGRMERVVEAVSLDAVLDSMARSFSIVARKKGLALTMNSERGLPSVIWTDGQKLEQILRNLLSNAIKFTDKGSVTLQIGRGDPMARGTPSDEDNNGHDRRFTTNYEGCNPSVIFNSLQVNDLTDGDAVNTLNFSVTDTGIGIPEERQADIFDAFKQVDGSISRKYGGTGLGLSISRQLAGILGGDIKVMSQPGHGTIFCLRLPERLPKSDTMDQK